MIRYLYNFVELIIIVNQTFKFINTYFKIDSNPYVGRLAFIYVNFEYIKKLLKESKRNKDGTLPLLAFIQTMFDGISTALGGINKIEVFEDTSTN